MCALQSVALRFASFATFSNTRMPGTARDKRRSDCDPQIMVHGAVSSGRHLSHIGSFVITMPFFSGGTDSVDLGLFTEN